MPHYSEYQLRFQLRLEELAALRLISVRPIFAFIIFNFYSTVGEAQPHTEIEEARTEHVERLLEQSENYREQDLERCADLAEQALQLAVNNDADSLTERCLQHLYRVYNSHKRYGKALKPLISLSKHYRKVGDRLKEAETLQMIGRMYRNLGDHARSLENYLEALRIFDSLNDLYRMAMVNFSIAYVYQIQERNTLSEKHFKESLQLLSAEETPDFSRMAIVATSLAGYYEGADLPDSAFAYYQKALAYSENIKSPYNSHAITLTLIRMSDYLQSNEGRSRAEEYNKKAYDLAKELDDPGLLALTIKNRAEIFLNSGDIDNSIESFKEAYRGFYEAENFSEMVSVMIQLVRVHQKEGDFETAIMYAKEALEIVEKEQLQQFSGELLTLLVDIHQDAENYAMALSYQQAYQQHRDSLLNRQESEQISKLQTLYETELKEKEILGLRNQAEKNRIYFLIVGVGVLVLVVIAFLIIRQMRLKRMKDKAEFRLKQNQLERAIKIKQQELTSYTLKFIQKNQILQEIRDRLHSTSKINHQTSPEVLRELENAVRNSMRFDRDWEEFQFYFEEVHPNFFAALKNQFPDLTQKDLRLCALLKLNMNTKEMATLIGISPGSVKMSRHRLRKKLNLGADDDLAGFMVNIEQHAGQPSR